MKSCYLCNKKYNTAVKRVMLRSRYNPTGTKKQKVNMKANSKLVPGKRVYICVKCSKSLNF